ncbi:MAG: hypothetical protein WCS69_10305 [Ignavibacteriaceae bacterium]|jgi:hypothetical protein
MLTNREQIKAEIWLKIIMLAFSPSKQDDIFTWLSCYIRSIPKFWEIEFSPARNPLNATIENQFINISYDYKIDSLSKSVINVFVHRSSEKYILWSHDIDKSYYSLPSNSILSMLKSTSRNKEEIINEEIESVLDGLIFHPTVHQHIIDDNIFSAGASISNHEIRIGGCIDNPFLYLFQLRYQFCLLGSNRIEEKNRLIGLFSRVLKKKSTIQISAGELFGFSLSK